MLKKYYLQFKQSAVLDYLKVNSEGECPDGKTILDWTTNTSCK